MNLMSLRFIFTPLSFRKSQKALDLRKLILSLVMLVERKTVFILTNRSICQHNSLKTLNNSSPNTILAMITCKCNVCYTKKHVEEILTKVTDMQTQQWSVLASLGSFSAVVMF